MKPTSPFWHAFFYTLRAFLRWQHLSGVFGFMGGTLLMTHGAQHSHTRYLIMGVATGFVCFGGILHSLETINREHSEYLKR